MPSGTFEVLPKIRDMGAGNDQKMTKRGGFLRHSLLLELGAALALIGVFALIGMAGSRILAESVQGSGEAINVAGSLRMQTYRMTSLALMARSEPGGGRSEALQRAVAAFERALGDARITGLLSDETDNLVSRSYATVEAGWHARVKPHFIAEARGDPLLARDALMQEVARFSADIDDLVKQIERETEAKIRGLRVVLGIALPLTLLVGALGLYLARTDLVLPLRDLLSFAAHVGRGNLDVRTAYTGSDELGRLGQAFNQMAEELSRLHHNLEARATEKTAQLTVANRSLELLYHSIARFYNGPVAPDTYTTLLKDLATVVGVRGAVCLTEAGATGTTRVIASTLALPDGADLCGVMNCGRRVSDAAPAEHALTDGRRALSLPLADGEQHYGVLQVEMPPGRQLEQWQIQLLEALSRHIGIAVGTARRSEQSRRVALLEERAALARDLHDSLAQSLAYMKIQVSRLTPLLENPQRASAAREVLKELREGLSSAYRQLRELLSTFRLRIESEGLAAALKATVDEFSERGDIPIALQVQLADCSLSANEEIHTLQIVREALSNVLNHAQAERAEVTLSCADDGSVIATVVDDGVGLTRPANGEVHHYGMNIMEERAKQMGGSLSAERIDARGTRVTLHFRPRDRRHTRDRDPSTDQE